MKKIVFLLFILPTLMLRCKDDEQTNTTPSNTGELRLKIVPTYAGKVYPMSSVVNSKLGFPMIVKRLAFFLQVQNGEAKVKDSNSEVAYFDFSSLTDVAKATEGLTTSFVMKKGDYTTLDIGIGVPKALNAKTPSDFANNNPLSEVSEYWSAWDSYIFTKTEGALDTAKINRFDLQYSYHTGTNDMFRTASLAKPFSITAGGVTNLTLNIDVSEILAGKTGTVDILKHQNAHSLNEVPTAKLLSDNYQNAFSFQ